MAMIRAKTAGDMGRLIREHRKHRGMSQAELATAMGVSRKWIVDVERGKASVALDFVTRTFRVLGASLFITLPEEDTQTQNEDPVEAALRGQRTLRALDDPGSFGKTLLATVDDDDRAAR